MLQNEKIEKINVFFKSDGRMELYKEDITDSLINKLYDLMFMSKEFNEDEITDSNELFYFGSYYHVIRKYDTMKRYYLRSIELNNNNAMYNLGRYYKNVEKNYDLMKKYYMMAIELNDSHAMNNLGRYYKNVEKNYDLMKKYYIMAIELNNDAAMNNLGYYYKNVEKNYDLMKKYYMMAIELNSSHGMNNLGGYYKNVEKNYDLMKKYYMMAIELNDTHVMNNLGSYYKNVEKNYNLMKKYYVMAVQRGNKMAIKNLKNYSLCNTDYSFLELYNCDHFKECCTDLINSRFKCNIINLPNKYKQIFINLDFNNNDNIDNVVKIKQNIYKLTLIFPSNYNSEYMEQFRAIESIVQNNECTTLNKDLLLHIAGRLFI